MADLKSEQEPSIEEILESIRQIISDDTEAAPAAAAAPKPKEPMEDKVVPLDLKPEPPKVEEPVILDLVDIVEDEKPEPEVDLRPPAEEPPLPAYTYDAPADDDTLLSDYTADAATDAMAKLLAGNIAVERELPGRVGKLTFEDMARELMRPLVKSWLDQNLPRLVEKMVAKEIEKLARRAMDR
jgi:cell pole-organizing protein PopZ